MIQLIARYTRWLHTQWPAGKAEKGPRLNEDGTTNVPGVRVVGDLTGVPLLKFSADTGAKAIQAIRKESDFEPGGPGEDALDVAIVGAGVSGVSAAIEAKKAGLRFAVYESQETFSTIKNFPRKKPIYTYPRGMEPAGEMRFKATVKEDLLEELRSQRETHGIEPVNAQVENIARRRDGLLELRLRDGEPVKTQRVVVAIGRTGNYRKLNVPGENLDKVSNRLLDPGEFGGRKTLVVGGGDSALEGAIALAEAGAEVALSYRNDALTRPKAENLERFEQLVEEGKIKALLGTNVQDIAEGKVVLCGADGKEFDLENDLVFTLIGREPPLDFFRRSGVKVTGDWSPASWAGLGVFLLFCVWLYHWKGWADLPGGFNITAWFSQLGWFPFNLPALGGETSLLGSLSRTARSDPGFWYSLGYCALVVGFGIRRVRKRRTPYVAWQTAALAAFQVVPLFLLPYLLFPWMGVNGAFTSGGFGQWFGETFLSNGPGTEPDQYWRAFGFVLAWPLFIWNVFTDQPLWGWLVVSVVQTFVIIPLIIRRWGKGAYCGWICSCGALAETLGDGHRQKMPHGPLWNRVNMLGQALLAVALLLLLLRVGGWIFPGSALEAAFNAALQKSPIANYKYLVDLWLAGVIGYGLYFHFSGRVWCRFACPLAALMHVYARFSRFRIFANKHKCISCNACTSVCHQGIDIMNFANKGRHMEDPECVRCSACVQVCPTGVLSFGRYDRAGQIRLERLPASPVHMQEVAAGTPIDAFLEEHRKGMK